MIRAVLDTNVVVSALLFSGPPSALVTAWQGARLRPVISAEILDEYVRVLAYPKFRLATGDIRSLVEEEILPFVETVRVGAVHADLTPDPADAKFVECALAGGVGGLVSGDAALLGLRRVEAVEIASVRRFLERLRRAT